MARLLVYDAYENKVYTYSNLRENDPMPYSTGRTLTVREFRGKIEQPGALDDHRGNGSVEPHPPQIRQGPSKCQYDATKEHSAYGIQGIC